MPVSALQASEVPGVTYYYQGFALRYLLAALWAPGMRVQILTRVAPIAI